MFPRKASVVIKDSLKLSFEYVPKELVHREAQMDQLLMLFRPVIESGRSETAFLSGSVGTGKTATAKRFCADLMRYGAENNVPVDYIIVNCRQRSTEAGILLHLVRHFDLGFPDRGFSSSEMLRTLNGQISKSGKKLVIVIDEADLLLKKGSVDSIYQLSRFSEESINIQSSVSLILISQEYIMDKLDEASISTFKRSNAVRFPKYTSGELKAIVCARAKEALREDGIRDDAAELIADIASEWGDARYAIELLDMSARKAEMLPAGVVTAEEVRAAKAETYSVVTESKLEVLDLNRLITLLAVARSIKDQSYVSTAVAEKTYWVVCEEYGITPRKHTQFWSYLKDLDHLALISTQKMADEEKGGVVSYISVPDIPSKELSKKIEAILDADLPPKLYNIS